MIKSVLSLRNLTAGYPAVSRGKAHVVAENLTVDLPAGELVCLIGPNGAGKSTLMRTISGMQKPLSGQVLLDGADIHQMSAKEIAKCLSVVLTERISAGMMTAYELVALGRHPHTNWAGTLTEHDHQVVKDSIETAGAAELAHRPVGELSDGEKQKVMVARALAQEPRLMILDEITAFLDLPRRVDVMRLLRDLAHATNRSILLSTHDLDLALRSSDRLWLLPKNGDFQVGVPEDLVLSGKFAAAFASEGIEFNEHEGSFRLNKNYHSAVHLEGEGLPYIWTARALERQGFLVSEGSGDSNGLNALQIEITGEASRPRWKIACNGEMHFLASLEELTAKIREHNGQI